MSEEFITVDGLESQITQFMQALDAMDAAVDVKLAEVADECAAMIEQEQKRLLATQHPQLTSLVKVAARTVKDKYVKVKVGYDSDTIRDHFELLVIEFGRPGKSARCSGEYEKKIRKGETKAHRKGEFPTSVSHIRAGYDVAHNKILQHFEDVLMNTAAERFSND